MSKERLSRLQKWILIEAYRKGKRGVLYYEDDPRYHDDPYFGDRYFIQSSEVHERFYGRRPTRTQSVALSRSVAGLRAKGYLEQIVRLGHRSGEGLAIVLSWKGIDKAKSITDSMTEQVIHLRNTGDIYE